MRRFLWSSLGALLLAIVAVASSGGSTGEARWVITDLGTPGEASAAVAINEQGQIAGYRALPSGNAWAALWEKGHASDLGSVPNYGVGSWSFNPSEALVAINERGDVLIQQSRGRPARVWQDGELRTLAPLGTADSSIGYAINDTGLIVGRSKSTHGVWPRAVVWSGGKPTALPLLPGGHKSEARGINNIGVLVGWSGSKSGNRHAVAWRHGRVVDLGTGRFGSAIALGLNEGGQVFGWTEQNWSRFSAVTWVTGESIDMGTLGGTWSSPSGINKQGQIIGDSEPGAAAPNSVCHAFLWERGKMRDLGTLAGHDYDSAAYDINDRGQVVGESDVGDREHLRAFLWEKGKMFDLGTLPGGKWSAALSINELGQIVGWSETRGDSQHAVLWTLKS